MSIRTNDNEIVERNNAQHIGAALKSARLQSGQVLADVSKTLRVQTRYLNAIECLDKTALPSLGYALGFVRSYAAYLGLDSADAVARYKRDIECPANMGISDIPHHVPRRKIHIPRGSFAAGLVLSCMLVVLTWYGWKSDARAGNMTNTPKEQSQNWGFEPLQVTQGNPDMISLKAVGSSWVHVTDKDGLVLISRIMVPGEIFETNRINAPLLSLRDAGAIELYLGGRRIGVIGQKGASAKYIPLATAAQ